MFGNIMVEDGRSIYHLPKASGMHMRNIFVEYRLYWYGFACPFS